MGTPADSFDLWGGLSLDEFVADRHWDDASDAEAGMFLKALHTATFQHRNQTRNGGQTKYTEHLLVVADGLFRLNFGIEVQIAGLLHDVQEDCNMATAEIRRRFGNKVSALVAYLSKDPNNKDVYFEQLYEGTQDHYEVIFIKLLDRWHNLTTAWGLRNQERQLRLLRETVGPMKELFDRCRNLIPEDRLNDYDVIVRQVVSRAEGKLRGMTGSIE